jgi:hypothetical protein
MKLQESFVAAATVYQRPTPTKSRPVRGQAGKIRRRVYLASLEKKAPLSGPRLGFPAKSGVSTGPRGEQSEK